MIPLAITASIPPEPWVERFAPLVPEGGAVLDLACGGGRHGRLFRRLGHPVVLLDRDVASICDMAQDESVEIVAQDLENGRPWPLPDRQFAGVVVVNYLHRPLFADLVQAVAPGGVLIYETFAVRNERFGRPSNPDFLLRPGELLEVVGPGFRIVAYEDVEQASPRPACKQRIAAIREA